MKLNYYSGLVIILFLFSSCTSFNNISEKEEKIDLSTNKLKKEANFDIGEESPDTNFVINTSLLGKLATAEKAVLSIILPSTKKAFTTGSSLFFLNSFNILAGEVGSS